jgi:hypothetical protein
MAASVFNKFHRGRIERQPSTTKPDELEFTNEEAMKKYEAKSQVMEFDAGEKKQSRLPLNLTSE